MTHDGRWRAEAIDEPSAALRLSGSAAPASNVRIERELPAASLDLRQRSRVAAIVVADTRRSFVVAFETLPELWEVSFDPEAPPVYDGMIHDWRMVEAIGVSAFLHPRRTPLPPELWPPIKTLSKPHGAWVLAGLQGREDAGAKACSLVALIHLDARRIVAHWRFAGVADVAGARGLPKGEYDEPLFELTLRGDDGRELQRMIAAPRGKADARVESACP